MGLPRNTKEEDLGQEATNRFLKAKLHVLQQELDKITGDRNDKDKRISLLEDKLKATDDEKQRSQKQHATSQQLLEKLKKQYDDQRAKQEMLEQELAKVKKEAEELGKHTRLSETDANTRDIKLNRALEEVDKLKSLLAKRDGEAKDKLEVAKRTADALFAENKALQRQKQELLAAFKKQSQLIAVLKRQKMHVEAAKLLQFTEEEFFKALNWNA